MATPSDLLARQLADEFERRAGPAAVLDAGARGTLVDEFRSRLDASKDPDGLAQNWRKNVDHYVRRATSRNPSQTGPVRVTGAVVSREFHSCAEICPPPENPG